MALANAKTQSTINSELLNALKLKKAQGNWTKGDYGLARVLDLATLLEREELANEKVFNIAFDDLRKLVNQLQIAPPTKPLLKLSRRGNAIAFKTTAKQFLTLLADDIFSFIFTTTITLTTSIDLTVLLAKVLSKSLVKKRLVQQVAAVLVRQCYGRVQFLRDQAKLRLLYIV